VLYHGFESRLSVLRFFSFRNRRDSIFLFFIYVFGAIRTADFGIGWDEYACRAHGTYNLVGIIRFISPSLVPDKYSYFPTLDDWYAFDHGAWFEVLLSAFEAVTRMENLHDIYVMRHLLTYSFCALGLFNLYLLLKKLKFSRLVVWVITFIAILSPRILADSYNNSKDLVFLSIVSIGMNIFAKYISQPSFPLLLSYSVICGLSVGHRVIAILLIPASLAALFISSHYYKRTSAWESIRNSFCFFIVSSSSFIISMPYLWNDPIRKIPRVLLTHQDFPWYGNVLFDGQTISAQNLPWNYLFIWILITTPLLYLALFFVGLILMLKRASTRESRYRLLNFRSMALFPYFSFVFVVLIAYLALKPTLYDGWRHFYFIYPVLLIVVSYGLEKIIELLKTFGKLVRIFAFSIVICNLLTTFMWMVDAHPLYNLYFNKIAGSQPVEKWEMDYWGVGNIQALRWILANEQNSNFSLAAISATPLSQSLNLLTKQESERIELKPDILRLSLFEVLQSKPTYLINNFRDVGIPQIDKVFSGYSIVQTLSVRGDVYLQIYRRLDK
jgi:hypothetical protein